MNKLKEFLVKMNYSRCHWTSKPKKINSMATKVDQNIRRDVRIDSPCQLFSAMTDLHAVRDNSNINISRNVERNRR